MFQFTRAAAHFFTRSNVHWFGVIGLSATLAACDGKPVDTGTRIGDGTAGNGSGSGATGGTLGSGGADVGGNGSVGGASPGVAGTNGTFLPPDEGTGGSTVCRVVASCEDLECGPIADGCGAFIECGGCQAPATCGGAGIPSECGIPGTTGGTCTPATCESLGVSCGQHGDGCGGVITCATCDVAGEECVQGTCQQTAGCTRLTCDAYPESGRCGGVSDGCSGILDCDFAECPSGQRCGAQEPGFCGVVTCTPWSCEEALAGKPEGYCGFVSDGCAGELAGCATVCGVGEACGMATDGGYLEVCAPTGSSGGCSPIDQNTACAGKCGVVGDNCTSTYTCNACPSGQLCGANNVPNVCGAAACVPTTCEAQGHAECGQVDDGCGGYLDCGTCSNGDTCAGAGVPFECGSPGCQPLSQGQACTAAGANCGPQTDGCSGVISCGTCSNGQTCGGGGTANQCGSSCTPLTCNVIGATCGPQGDGCGNQINCGSCGSNEVCQGTPSACVPDLSCPNLCQSQATCTPGSETSITGKVYAPNGAQALYNALVYVPNIPDIDDLPALSSGINTNGDCERCEDEDLGQPLVAALTGPDGVFTLNNVPSGVAFPLVVKMGKWRRVTMIPAVAACSSNALDADDARLPRSMTDAPTPELIKHVNIPKMAVVSGKVDAIECVLRKIGVADTEFSVPTGSGRIHLFTGINGATKLRNPLNAAQTTTTQVYTTLYSGSPPAIDAYDMAILDCEGGEKKDHRNTSQRSPLYAYANAGGRVFASHYSYTYLDATPFTNGVAQNQGGPVVDEFATTATWAGPYNDETDNPTTGLIDVSGEKGQAFNAWLTNEGALHPTYGSGYISITDPREYVKAATAGITERFVYTSASHVVPGFPGTGTQPNGNINVASSVQQYSFGTPVGSNDDQVCGRVLYSAFHVAGQNLNTQGATFPDYCSTTLTPQEKILEFMIFDLSACVTPFLPPTCAPKTCMELGNDCGFVSDGCGGIQNCGTCVAPASCGGGGTPNVCGSTCALKTCTSAGATCGTIGDGCGGTLDCGTCDSGSTCGGGGTPNVCGTPACVPRTCQQASATCGNIGDGCGGTLNCGTCVSPQFCGGGGPNTCGTTTCTPSGCGSANCGSVGDGCGNAINCGTCAPGSACGAGGTNLCGPVCTPTTCNAAGKNCGSIGDGCGGVLNCGLCSEGTVCGGGGTPNVCGGSCTPVTCTSAGAACGTIGDGCGGILSCGTCPTGQVCGANNQANQCGQGSCTPDTCGGLCGTQSDGCSGSLDCGPCNGCVPFSCVSHVDCGPVADGCGSLIDCGGCIGGNSCGGGGVASQCGGGIQ